MSRELKKEVKQGISSGSEMSLAHRGRDLSSLREKTGIFKKLDVAIATSRAAGEALKRVQIEQIHAEANIALTALKLSEGAIRTSMVASAMPAFGALTVKVNAATTCVDQALSNSVMAETCTHLTNRASNVALARELHAGGKINSEETDVVISFAQSDTATDIERSRKRMADAKEAVAGLHEFALRGIADAKDRLF